MHHCVSLRTRSIELAWLHVTTISSSNRHPHVCLYGIFSFSVVSCCTLWYGNIVVYIMHFNHFLCGDDMTPCRVTWSSWTGRRILYSDEETISACSPIITTIISVITTIIIMTSSSLSSSIYYNCELSIGSLLCWRYIDHQSYSLLSAMQCEDQIQIAVLVLHVMRTRLLCTTPCRGDLCAH